MTSDLSIGLATNLIVLQVGQLIVQVVVVYLPSIMVRVQVGQACFLLFIYYLINRVCILFSG
jgi:hypothetical protein